VKLATRPAPMGEIVDSDRGERQPAVGATLAEALAKSDWDPLG
jgi:hypothetical protein